MWPRVSSAYPRSRSRVAAWPHRRVLEVHPTCVTIRSVPRTDEWNRLPPVCQTPMKGHLRLLRAIQAKQGNKDRSDIRAPIFRVTSLPDS
eukprot:4253668-Prymnesium_polylepis.1